MSDDSSIVKSTDSVEDSNLVSHNDSESLMDPSMLGYIAILISVVAAVFYLFSFSAEFDSNQYLETPSIAQEMASLSGGSSGGGDAVEVAFDPVKEGENVYMANCMACHQVTGSGVPGAFPPLAESEWVGKSPELLARIVLHGLQGPITVSGTEYNSIMAPLGVVLNDDQIAHTLTYIRQAWGNAADPVDPAVVAAVRSETSDRTAMWTVEELQPWMGE